MQGKQVPYIGESTLFFNYNCRLFGLGWVGLFVSVWFCCLCLFVLEVKPTLRMGLMTYRVSSNLNYFDDFFISNSKGAREKLKIP